MQITIFGTLSSVDPLIARALAGTGRKLTGRCNQQTQIAGPALDAYIRDLLKSKIGPAALIIPGQRSFSPTKGAARASCGTVDTVVTAAVQPFA